MTFEEKLLEGIPIDILDIELVALTNLSRERATRYIIRRIRDKIQAEIIQDWRKVLATDTE